MKNRLILILGLFFLSRLSSADPLTAVTYDGCGYPRVESNLGLGISNNPFGSLGKIYLPPYVSYSLQIIGPLLCMNFKKISLYRNDILLETVDTSGRWYNLKIGAFPGSYRLHLDFESIYFYYKYCDWTFEILDSPTSIEDFALDKKLVVYPNPAQNQIQVESDKEIKTVTIYDLNGAKILTAEINAARAELPVDHIPKGVYVVQIATITEEISFRKFVKQ